MLLQTPIIWPSAPVNSTHPLAGGLISWWLVIPQFTGGTRLRELICGGHGTLTAMALSPTATSGLAKGTSRNGGFGEVRCDGTDDYVNIPTSTIFDTAKITVCAWAKTSITSGMIVARQANSSIANNEWRLGINASKWHWRVMDSVGTLVTAESTTKFSLNQWHHVCGTFDGVNVTLYVDGVQTAQSALSGTLAAVSCDIKIGARENTPAIFFNGAIDDVRIYKRALSLREVSTLYGQSLGGYRELLNYVQLFTVNGTPKAYSFSASFGSYAYSGQVASLLRSKLVSNVQGAYTYTGQAASLLRKQRVTNGQGSYAYSGQAVSLLKKKLISNVQGVYTYTGQVILLERGRFVAVNSGGYVYTGQAVTFAFGKSVPAQQGAYVYTGQTINSIWQQIIAAVSGSYVYSGQTVQLLHKQSIVSAQGSYTYNGQAAVFRLGKSLSSVAGNYTYTGQVVNMLWKRIITAVSGSYSYSGQPVTFSIHTPFVLLPIGIGVYTYTGQVVTLLNKQLVLANSGSYAYTGQPASLRESGIVSSMLQGAYVYTGQVVTLLNKQLIPLVTGVYTLNGQDVALLSKHINVHTQGGYTYTGQPVNLLRGKPLLSITGNYIYTGQPVQFPYSQRLSAVFGQYVYTGQSVSLLAIVQEALFIIEMNIIPTVNGTVKIQAFPIGPASNVIVKQGSTGFMFDV